MFLGCKLRFIPSSSVAGRYASGSWYTLGDSRELNFQVVGVLSITRGLGHLSPPDGGQLAETPSHGLV